MIEDLLGHVISPNTSIRAYRWQQNIELLRARLGATTKSASADALYSKSDAIAALNNLDVLLPDRSTGEDCYSVYDWANTLAEELERLEEEETISSDSLIAAFLRTQERMLSLVPPAGPAMQREALLKLVRDIMAVSYVDSYGDEILRLVLPRELYRSFMKRLAAASLYAMPFEDLGAMRDHCLRIEDLAAAIKDLASWENLEPALKIPHEKVYASKINIRQDSQVGGQGLFLYRRSPSIVEHSLNLWTPFGSVRILEAEEIGEGLIEKIHTEFGLREVEIEIPYLMWDDTDTLYALERDAAEKEFPEPKHMTEHLLFKVQVVALVENCWPEVL